MRLAPESKLVMPPVYIYIAQIRIIAIIIIIYYDNYRYHHYHPETNMQQISNCKLCNVNFRGIQTNLTVGNSYC